MSLLYKALNNDHEITDFTIDEPKLEDVYLLING